MWAGRGGSSQAKEGSTKNLICAGVSLMAGALESQPTLPPGHRGQRGGSRPQVHVCTCMHVRAYVNMTICSLGHCSLQAKDKDRWIRLFSQFCNKTANEEEEIVHKLLGDKFKVSLCL